jgi:hypothetical protein
LYEFEKEEFSKKFFSFFLGCEFSRNTKLRAPYWYGEWKIQLGMAEPIPSPISFTKWNSLVEYVKSRFGHGLYSGQGITNPKERDHSILRSVDGTSYYKDDLGDWDDVYYTLFGREGDQNPYEKRFNKPLLYENRLIYLYRVLVYESGCKKGTGRKWIWYGCYEQVGPLEEIIHPDVHVRMRKIYRIRLKRVGI